MLPHLLLPETMTLVWTLLEDAAPVRFSAAVYAVFPLLERQTPEPEPQLAPADEFWPLIARSLGEHDVVDTGFPKPCAEFLLYGACHSPKPTQACQVRARVASLDKTLNVFGPRRWGPAGIERYGEFSHMPLNMQHAFGGPEFEANPYGMGHKSAKSPLLPHVEDPDRQIGSRSDTPLPAGFFALQASWPQRSKYLGRFDKCWLKERWPHLPDDTKPEFCNTAPPEQWLSGHFRGNEALRLENMHPERRVITSTLPGVRARLFCQRQQQESETPLEEIPLKAETLWLFPEFERGVLLFRGVFSAKDDELADMNLFYAAWEGWEQTPLSVEHYSGQLRQKLADAEKVEDATAQEPLADEATDEAAEDQATQHKPAAATQTAAAAAGGMELLSPEAAHADVVSQLQACDQEAQAALQQVIEETGATDEQLAQFDAQMNDIELEQQQAEAAQEAGLHEFMRSQGLSTQQIQEMGPEQRMEMAAKWLEQQSEAIAREQGLSLRQLMETQELPRQALQEQDAATLHSLLREAVAGSNPIPEMQEFEAVLQEMQALEVTLQNLALPAAGMVASAGSQPAEMASEQAGLQAQEPAEPPATAEPAPAFPPATSEKTLRETVTELRDAGKKLAGLDLSGADLSGLDLSGCDLSRCRLAGANMENCNLSQAVLDRCDLREVQLGNADCTGASFREATISLASGEQVNAADACFADADLSQAHFVHSTFTGADFGKSYLKDAVFDLCACNNARFYACKARRTAWLGCDLSNADFAKAKLPAASFQNTRLHKTHCSKAKAPELRLQGATGAADFSEAKLVNSRADEETCLDGSIFDKADLQDSCWAGASLRETRFDKASLQRMDLGKTDLFRAHMRHCRMQTANLSKAKLHETDLGGSNAMEASLRKAELLRAHCYRTNFFAADFYMASFSHVNLQRANLKRTLMAGALPEAR